MGEGPRHSALTPSFLGFAVCRSRCPAPLALPIPHGDLNVIFQASCHAHLQTSVKSIPPWRAHLLPQMHKINNTTSQNVLNMGPFIHRGKGEAAYKDAFRVLGHFSG